jgi:hypothetical protein
VDSKGSVWVAGGLSVYKLSPAGDAILATASFPAQVGTLCADGSGNAYLTYGNEVFKLGPDGAQLFTLTLTEAQQDELISAIACDPAGDVYVSGFTEQTFTNVRSIGSPGPATSTTSYVAKVKPDGSGLAWAAYINGIADTIAVDEQGNVWWAGISASTTLPVTTQSLYNPGTTNSGGFLTKLDSSGTAFQYLSWFPTSIRYLSTARDGSVFAAGTASAADFPQVHAIENIAPATVGSLLETTDGGSSWQLVYPSLPGTVLAISADPSAPGTLVAVSTSGIYLSTNEGKDWTLSQELLVFSGQELPFVTTRVFLSRDPSNGSIIWAGGLFGLYRSADGGRNWMTLQSDAIVDMSPVPGNPDQFVDINSRDQLYQLIFLNGAWNLQELPDPAATAVRATSDGSLYLGNAGLGLVKVSGLTTNPYFFHYTAINPLPGPLNVESLDTSSKNPLVVYVVTDGTLFRTQDGGNTWTTGEISPWGGLTRITVAPSNDETVYGVASASQNCGTVTVTNDGGQTWSRPSPDLALSCITGLSVSPMNPGTAWAIATPSTLGFVAHVTADGSSFAYSSLLSDIPTGLATNGTDVFLSGTTTAGHFPTGGGAVTTGEPGVQVAFVERISDSNPSCTVAVSPSDAYAWSPHSPVTFSVLAPAGCSWQVSGQPSWITVPSGTSGESSGLVTVVASPDASTPSRTATFTIGGESVSVTAPGASCTYSIAPGIATVDYGGGTAQFTLNTGAGCPWSIIHSQQPGLTLESPTSGVGTGKVAITVTTNPSATVTRQFGVQIAGLAAQISQAANCTYQLSFNNPSDGPVIGPDQTNSTIGVVTGNNCSWQLLSDSPWAFQLSDAFPGTGFVSVSVSPNPLGPTRIANLFIGNQSLQLTQLSSVGTWKLTTSANPATAGTVAVNPPPHSGGLYNDLTRVCVQPIANPGWIFTGWSGDSPDFSNCITISTNWSVTANFAPAPSPMALQFFPITPCRVADTRNPNGAFGGPSLAAATTRDLVIPNSACQIPFIAAAYSLNIAVVPAKTLANLTVWPSGISQPQTTLLTSPDGRIKSGAAIVAAGLGGAVSFNATDQTDLIVDINGYFIPTGTPSYVALAFYPLSPCRVADTRNTAGPLGGPSIEAGQSRTFPIQSSTCGVPPTATAYSLNLSAVPAGPLGYLTAWPTGQNQPTVATLNAVTGTITANAAIVPAGNNGSIDVYATNATDVVIDINGYFAPPDASGLSLYTLPPCRLLDTRNSGGAFSGTLRVDAGGSCGIPAAANALVLNATVLPTASLGYLTLWPAGQAQPVVATLNAVDAAVTSNMAIVPETTGFIDAFVTGNTNLILDIAGYFGP